MLFHTTNELQIVMHGVMKASMLCEGAIRVRTSQPSAAHMRAYMAAITGEPSSAQPLLSDGEEEPHFPHGSPHPGGRTLQHLQANLGGLTDNELQQLMEELCREITLWELNAPHHKHLGEILWEMGILMWMNRRSPFWEGGGFPRATFWPPAPAQPDRGWEPGGQPPQSPLHLPLLNLGRTWGIW